MSFSIPVSALNISIEIPVTDSDDTAQVIGFTPIRDPNVRNVSINILGNLYTCKAEDLKELGRKIDLLFN